MSASHPYDAVLLLAFGGPGDENEIRPFLERVLAGRPVPRARIEEVAHHYEALGGRSPLPDITRLQAHALAEVLKQLGLEVPVYVGFRHSAPFFLESLATMSAEGVVRALSKKHRRRARGSRQRARRRFLFRLARPPAFHRDLGRSDRRRAGKDRAGAAPRRRAHFHRAQHSYGDGRALAVRRR